MWTLHSIPTQSLQFSPLYTLDNSTDGISKLLWSNDFTPHRQYNTSWFTITLCPSSITTTLASSSASTYITSYLSSKKQQQQYQPFFIIQCKRYCKVSDSSRLPSHQANQATGLLGQSLARYSVQQSLTCWNWIKRRFYWNFNEKDKYGKQEKKIQR